MAGILGAGMGAGGRRGQGGLALRRSLILQHERGLCFSFLLQEKDSKACCFSCPVGWNVAEASCRGLLGFLPLGVLLAEILSSHCRAAGSWVLLTGTYWCFLLPCLL